MRSIIDGNHRKGIAAWRKAFKREWNVLQNYQVESQDLLYYNTDPSKWICTGQIFLLGQFLICEHIIHCYEKMPDRSKFFSEVYRQRKRPFWVEEQLILRSEYRSLTLDMESTNDNGPSHNETEPESESNSNSIVEDLVGIENDDEEVIFELEERVTETLLLDAKECLNTIKSIATLLKELEAIGDAKFIEAYVRNISDLITYRILLVEIQQVKRPRTMPATWSRKKHPATMY